MVVVAVVAVVAVLLALNFTGIFVFIPGTGPTTPPAASSSELTFAQAENIANSTASARGGTWEASLATSIQSTQAFNVPGTAPCNLYGYSPASSSVGGNGEAYVWGFIYLATPWTFEQPDKQLFIVVQNGTGTVTTQLNPEAECPGISYPAIGPLPSNITNSPAAAAKLNAVGGAGFLASYPSASLDLLAGALSTGLSSWDPVWIAEYVSSCSTLNSRITDFSAELEGTDLNVMSHGWSNESCTGQSEPSYPVSFTKVSSGASTVGSVFYDNYTLSAPSGLTTADLGLAILQSNKTLVEPGAIPLGCALPPFTGCGGASSTGGWYALLLSGGAIVGAYPGLQDETGWDTGGTSVPISTSLTLELVSTSPLSASGDSLVAFTWDDAVVSGSATL